MLSPQKIRRYLNHNSLRLREFAARYLSESYSQDPKVMQLVLQSCDYYGPEENALLLGSAAGLKQTQQSLKGVLKRLAEAADANTVSQYNSIIRSTDPQLLHKFSGDILNCDNLSTVTAKVVESKIDASNTTTEQLWEEVLSYADKYGQDLTRQQTERGQHAVEVLAGRDDLPLAEAVDKLREYDGDGSYDEILLVELVGRRQMRQTACLLMDRLGAESSWLGDTAVDALVRMGDDQLIEALADQFPRRDLEFRRFAAPLFGRVKLPSSEQALLNLLPAEDDNLVRTLLAMSLGYLASEDGIPLLQEMVDDGAYDQMMVDLPRLLETVRTLVGNTG